MLTRFAAIRRALGHRVYVLDPFGQSRLPSAKLNVLAELNPESRTLIDDVAAITQALIVDDGDARSRHWSDSARTLLSGIVLLTMKMTMTMTLPEPERNLVTVRQLLSLTHPRLLEAVRAKAFAARRKPGAKRPSENALAVETLFREIILAADNALQDRLLWQLWRCMSNEKDFWLSKVVEFLRNVWPKQRALRLPNISARLASIALAGGDRMPEIVELILPRLIKLRTSTMIMIPDRWLDGDFELEHPHALLDLFWVVLPEDVTQWPFKADAVIRKLGQMPGLSSDQRLGELRRRLEDRS